MFYSILLVVLFMLYSVLFYYVVCFSVFLFYFVLFCSILLCCPFLFYVINLYSIMFYSIFCSVLFYFTVFYYVVLYSVLFCSVLFYVVFCSVLLCCLFVLFYSVVLFCCDVISSGSYGGTGRSGVHVEFSALSFYFRSYGDLTPDELDAVGAFLHGRVMAQERTQLYQLKTCFKAFRRSDPHTSDQLCFFSVSRFG